MIPGQTASPRQVEGFSMGSFGERLRREREMRGITIEEIAEATKIGSRNLRALEDEKFDLLPGGIFNKGFVRAYSKFLGLDEEQAVADYLAAEGSFRDASSDAPDVPVETADRSLVVPIALGLILVLAAGGFGGWKYYQKKRAEASAAAENSKAILNVKAEAPTPAAVPPVDPNAQPAATPADANVAPAGTTLASTSTTAPAPENSTAPAADGFIVQVRANQDSWVSAKADGKSVLSETLKASNEKTLHARDRIVLTLGNVAGVQVSYNGKSLNLGSASGQVKTVIFTAQGLQPDAPEQR
jgi:cytoskeleton protein RodZ